MDFTIQLLHTNDPPSVLAGLQCLLAICRAYRFKAGDGENRTHFDKIIEASFPRLLAISTELIAQESEEAGEMLHIALKAYKHATWVSCLLILGCCAWWSLSLTLSYSLTCPHSFVSSRTPSAGALSSCKPFPRLPPRSPCRKTPSIVNEIIGGRQRNGHISTLTVSI